MNPPDHNHPQFHLLGRRIGRLVLVVVDLNLRRRNDKIILNLLLAHRLDDDLIPLDFLESRQCESLCLQSANEGGTVAAELLANNGLHAIVDDVFRDTGALLLKLLELLKNQLAIYKVLYR